MIFGYESPGINALGWLAEKTIKPETLEFFNRANDAAAKASSIQWGFMVAQVVLIAGIGVCGYVAAAAVDQKPTGTLIALTTVACCLSSIAQCVTR